MMARAFSVERLELLGISALLTLDMVFLLKNFLFIIAQNIVICNSVLEK